MRNLIVGCLGFIGSNLSVHFSRAGHSVIGVDNSYKQNGSEKNMKYIHDNGVKFEYLDIRNVNDVNHFFLNQEQFDVIINMAAQVAFSISMKNPRLDFEINALGTFNLLEAYRHYSPNAQFIYGSTNQVYGSLPDEELIELEKRFDFKNLKTGVPETYPLDFLSPYGCSKGAGDQYVHDYGRVFDLDTVVTRFGGVYGYRQYSYEDHGWVSFIAGKIDKGESYNRFGHGKQVRDILFVTDIVDAIDAIVKNRDRVSGEIINISGGPENTLSVLELIDLVCEISSNKDKSIVNPMRSADKVVMYLDISKAEDLIGWRPKVDPKTGIRLLLDWQRKM